MSSAGMSKSTRDVATCWEMFHVPHSLTEVRVLKGKFTLTEKFGDGDFKKFVTFVKFHDSDERTSVVYVSMNPISEKPRTGKKHKKCGGTSPPGSDVCGTCGEKVPWSASDDDVLARHNVLVDFDPVRCVSEDLSTEYMFPPNHPSGEGEELSPPASKKPATPSRRDELLLARDAAREAHDVLVDMYDFPEPVVTMSGNGVHLLFRTDLPNLPCVHSLVIDFLKAVKAVVGGNHVGVDVDVNVANPSRLTKVYGTKSRKGKAKDGRPHRTSKIVVSPKSFGGEVLSREKMVVFVTSVFAVFGMTVDENQVVQSQVPPTTVVHRGGTWKKKMNNDLFSIDAIDVFGPLPASGNFAHPAHGSSSGSNCVYHSGSKSIHCFSDKCDGGAGKGVEVLGWKCLFFLEGMDNCGEIASLDSKSGEVQYRAYLIAREHGLLSKESPMTNKATNHMLKIRLGMV